jgi:hypothetical protein
MKDIRLKHEKDVRSCFCIAVIFEKDVPQSKFTYSEREIVQNLSSLEIEDSLKLSIYYLLHL